MPNTLQSIYTIAREHIPDIPEVEIRMILCKINGLENMSDFYTHKDEPIKDYKLCNTWLNKLRSGMPVQYIINTANFCKRDFYVDSSVLIPRMETEEVAIFVLTKIKERYVKQINVLDMCSGSGCIGITVAKETDATVTLSDISFKANLVAKKNAKKHAANVTILKSDLFEKINDIFDVIIANPPYIKNEQEIDKRTRDFEPAIALMPKGETVKEFYSRIIKSLPIHLTRDGIAVLEIGYDLKEELEGLLVEYKNVFKYSFIKDINGKDRILYIERI